MAVIKERVFLKNIVNVVNFVRAVEPRERIVDLVEPVKQHIALLRENGLPGTFLLQYDALIDPVYQELMESCRDFCEIGLWLEVVQPQVEAAGGVWQGRFPWDWHNDVGFLIGYEPEFRKKLIDVAMEKYRELYGSYPRSVGSWHIDAVSMAYLSDQYQVAACCNCRDQVGTDGYTMQGGYFNQAYYPSRANMFCPAQTEEMQIPMPVFRMLGSDPIECYDSRDFDYGTSWCIASMEPVYHNEPGEDWSAWFMEQVMGGNGLCFQYVQIGQENSFGWEAMKHCMPGQYALVRRLREEGKVEVLTLADAGAWYRAHFSVTPAATCTAMQAYTGRDYRSVWYSSRYYRSNLFWNYGTVTLRDLYIFDETYPEHYLTRRCDTTACEFRNLPVMDAAIYSTKELRAGIYFSQKDQPICFDSMDYSESGGKARALLKAGEKWVCVVFEEEEITVTSNIDALTLVAKYDKQLFVGGAEAERRFGNHNNSSTVLSHISDVAVEQDKATLTFDGFRYTVGVLAGTMTDFFRIVSAGGSIKLRLAQSHTSRG